MWQYPSQRPEGGEEATEDGDMEVMVDGMTLGTMDGGMMATGTMDGRTNLWRLVKHQWKLNASRCARVWDLRRNVQASAKETGLPPHG